MKHLVSLFRPADPRTRRPRGRADDESPRWRPRGRAGGPDDRSTGAARAAAASDHLVALYAKAFTLRDCALVETRVAEDALSSGDEVRATQHFSYSRHYRQRADEAEAGIHAELRRLRWEGHDCERLSASALTRARKRLYGSPDLAARPQFD